MCISDLVKNGGLSVWLTMVERQVHDSVEGIFRRHGAVRINTPLLMPRSPLYTAAASEANVCFMDRSGGLVSLPYDLRVRKAHSVALFSVYVCKHVYKLTK